MAVRSLSGVGAVERREQQRFDRAARVAKAVMQAERLGDEIYADPDRAENHPCKDQPLPFSACLVTGCEGMVGKRLLAMLARRGVQRIVGLDKAEQPSRDFAELADTCKREHGASLEYVHGDITSRDALACDEGTGSLVGNPHGPFAGVEVVFHLAALVGPYFKTELYDQVNHQGARNVLEAFLRNGGCTHPDIVLVDCSSPSTRYEPTGDMNGVMEHQLSYQSSIHEYATTKALGEKAILDSNGARTAAGGRLATCAVAPHQVYAPEDRLFLPAVLDSAQAGSLRIIGSGENYVSFTHADNIAHALILAAAKLWREGPSSPAAGEFFVVTDGTAHNFWDALDTAVVGCGMPSIREKMMVPVMLMWCIAYLGVVFTKFTGKFVKITPFSLRMIVINRHFCIAKARNILGYRPVISFEEGWCQTVAANKERILGKSKVV